MERLVTRLEAAPRDCSSVTNALKLWSWTLKPGERRDSDPHRPGSLELPYVKTGTVRLDVGQHHAEIKAGDSA